MTAPEQSAETVRLDNASMADFRLVAAEAVEQRQRAERAEAALRGAKDDIKARIDNFRRLAADSQYMNALNDAWGLVANRERSLPNRHQDPR